MSKKKRKKDIGTNKYNPALINDDVLSKKEKKLLLKVLKSSDYIGNLWFYLLFSIFILTAFGYTFLYVYEHDVLVRIMRWLAIPIIMLYAYSLQYVQKLTYDSGAGYKLKKDWRRPILYLRSFDTDGAPIIEDIKPSRNLFSIARIKRSVERKVWNRLQKYGPLVALSGWSNEGYGVPARIKYLSNEEWKRILIIFLKISAAVVIVVPKNISESIDWEINQISKIKSPKDVIFFISEKDISIEEATIFFNKISAVFHKNVNLRNYPTNKNSFLCLNKSNESFEIIEDSGKFFDGQKINDNKPKYNGSKSLVERIKSRLESISIAEIIKSINFRQIFHFLALFIIMTFALLYLTGILDYLF